MESAHRYRLLIYFAALVLCLSVCFANAEPIQSPISSRNAEVSGSEFHHSPVRSGFMPVLQQAYIQEAVVNAAAPVVSQTLLSQITAESQKSHRFWHTKKRASLILIHAQGAAPQQSAHSLRTGADDAAQSE